MSDTTNKCLQWEAAVSLGKLKNKDALPDLRKQRKHPNRLVRDAVNEAIEALEAN